MILVAAPQGRGQGCLVAALVVVAVIASVSLLLNLAFLGAFGVDSTGVVEEDPLVARRHSGSGESRIALIEVSGIIAETVPAPGIYLPVFKHPVERLRRELDAAAADERVKAVVLRVDSPGGTTSASDAMHHLLKTFRDRARKPIVVSMGGLATSGGYYISTSGDLILAEPQTVTGSIGVVLMSVNVHDFMTGMLKVEPITIKHGANKDLLNPFEPRNDEHIAIVQAVVDEAYERFVAVIIEGRKRAGLTEEMVRDAADGSIYTSRRALELKLVDAIGYVDDAVAKARALCAVAEATVIRYEPRPSLAARLLGGGGDGGSIALALGASGGDTSAGPGSGGSGGGGGMRFEGGFEGALDLAAPRVLYVWAPFAGAGR